MEREEDSTTKDRGVDFMNAEVTEVFGFSLTAIKDLSSFK